MGRLSLAVFVAASFLVPAVAAPAALVPPAPRLLTFEALRALVSVREPKISPDGKRVAFIRSVGDYKADRSDVELDIVDVATGTRRVLTRERTGVTAPDWSPSGDRIGYLASPERGKPVQLYVLRMDGGDSAKITAVTSGVRSFAWRPDGGAFAYVADDEPKKTPAPGDFVPAFPVTDEHFLTRVPSRAAHVWAIDADGTHPRQITHGAESPTQSPHLQWTRDGASLVATLQPDAVFAHFTKARTMLIDASTGAMKPIVPGGIDGGGVLSNDGTRIALAIPRHGSIYLQSDAGVRDLTDGHEVQSGIAIDRKAHWFEFSPDDRTLLVATADGVRNVLWRLPIGGAPAQVDLGEVDFGPDASVAHDGSVAFVGQRRDDPGEIYVLPPGPNAAPRRLTNENAFLAGYALARRERVDWTSDDGLKIDGVLTYPAGYRAGKKYPLILDIHGGPVATSTWDFGSVEGTLCQVLSARGYLVLQPNYRGSDNAGDAFLNAIVPHVASGPARDNLAGVEALKRMGIVDETRIGVSGWSGGGLQTGWLIGHASYWRAAVAGAGVYDWWQQAVLADINEQFAVDFLGGASPWTAQGRAAFKAESPITYAAGMHAPLLILSDTGDQRVPIAQSYALFHALRDRGRTVKFIAFPRAGHFPSDPVGRETVLSQWAGWFDRWMK